MEILNNTYLNFIDFKELSLWDVKRLFLSSIKSDYKIVLLKEVIKERSEKIKLFNFHDKEFGILGVNNKEGIFDAYKEFGKNINQPYKKVYNGDLAYNPYRVNVGSVGIKLENHKFDYISPAYVVFSCDKTQLLPEFFYILFKSNLFNGLINENTTGSVRQNLTFTTLSNIKIPLPSLEEQNKIVIEYNKKLQDSVNAETKSKELEKEVESYLVKELGIEVREKEEKKFGLNFVDFKDIKEWELSKIVNNNSYKSKYKQFLLSELCNNFGNGVNFSGEQVGKGTKFVNIKDVYKDDFLVIDDLGKVEIKDAEILSKKVSKNDIIFVRSSVKYEGVAYPILVKEELIEDIVFCGFLIKCSINSTVINPEYLLYVLKADFIRNILINLATKTVITNISQDKLKNLNIPFPPLEIQEKIVKHISELKDEIKRLRKLSQELKESARVEFEKEIFS